jgi:hypothetical protein
MTASPSFAVALVIFTAFVRVDTQQTFGIPSYFPFNARDILDTPYGFLNNEAVALDLMDRLCSQPFIQRSGDLGTVFGALNLDTGEFKTWAQYLESEGRNDNVFSNFANGPWNTFWGICSLKAKSTSLELGPVSCGEWEENVNPPRGRATKQFLKSAINVVIPGFTAISRMPSWQARCNNPQFMADEFKRLLSAENRINQLVGDQIVTPWLALDKVQPETPYRLKDIRVTSGKKGRAVATTALRVVHAVQTFEVGGWYWHYSDHQYGHGSGDTWMDLGPDFGDWKTVFTRRGSVKGRGPTQQLPPPGSDRRRHERRQWDSRVLFTTEEIDL